MGHDPNAAKDAADAKASAAQADADAKTAQARADSAMTKANTADSNAANALTTANNVMAAVYWVGDAFTPVPAIASNGSITLTVTWSSAAPTVDYTVASSLIVPAVSLALLGTVSVTPVLDSRSKTTCQFIVKNSGLVAISVGQVQLHAIGARGYRPS